MDGLDPSAAPATHSILSLSKQMPRTTALTPQPNDIPGSKIAELDGLRGIAIIMVLVQHMASEDQLQPYPIAKVLLYPFSTLGWTGVDLFFVLSGFLITGILLESKKRVSVHYFRNFYARRVLRIMPIYYLSLFLVFVVWRGFFQRWVGTAGDHKIYYLFYLQNWLEIYRMKTGFSGGYIGHFWSLALEEQFYVIWPCIVWFLSPRRLLSLSFAMLGGALIARLVFNAIAQTGFEFYNYSSFTRYDELLFGAIVAVGRSEYSVEMEQFARQTSNILLPGLLVALAITLALFGAWSPQVENPLMRIIGYTLLAAISAGLILKALYGEADGLFRRSLRARGLAFVGTISYGLYIYHLIIKSVVVDWTHDLPRLNGIVGVAVLTLTITFVVAYVSYRFFEMPLLRLKRYFPM
jgi:peptidoglycan/LPS O-acetylase OafA/YrhL